MALCQKSYQEPDTATAAAVGILPAADIAVVAGTALVAAHIALAAPAASAVQHHDHYCCYGSVNGSPCSQVEEDCPTCSNRTSTDLRRCFAHSPVAAP